MSKAIKKIIGNFTDFLKKEKGYSQHTFIAYKSDLENFFIFCEEYFGSRDIDLKKINRQIVREYLSFQLELGNSVKTRYRKLATIKSFFKYMIREKTIIDSPAEYIPMPKIEKKIPRFIQQGDNINQLMSKPEEFEQKKYFQAEKKNKKRIRTEIREQRILRDRAMLELFYASGIRRSELVSLNIGSIDLQNRLLKVLGKGKKERIVPFNRFAEVAMKNYVKHRGIVWNKDLNAPLFTGPNQKRISIRTVSRRIGEYVKDLSVNNFDKVNFNNQNEPKLGEGGPHTLRHTFGSHLIDNEADIRAIQELLGHSSISSTQIYTNTSAKKIKKVYKKAHPRGQ